MVTERAAYAESSLILKAAEDHLRAAPIRPVDNVIVIIKFQIRVEPRDICILAPGCFFGSQGFYV